MALVGVDVTINQTTTVRIPRGDIDDLSETDFDRSPADSVDWPERVLVALADCLQPWFPYISWDSPGASWPLACREFGRIIKFKITGIAPVWTAS